MANPRKQTAGKEVHRIIHSGRMDNAPQLSGRSFENHGKKHLSGQRSKRVERFSDKIPAGNRAAGQPAINFPKRENGQFGGKKECTQKVGGWIRGLKSFLGPLRGSGFA